MLDKQYIVLTGRPSDTRSDVKLLYAAKAGQFMSHDLNVVSKIPSRALTKLRGIIKKNLDIGSLTEISANLKKVGRRLLVNYIAKR